MKEIIVNKEQVIIRKAEKEDAKQLIEYLNKISGESDFLTFGSGELGIDIKQEEQFIENALNKENALFIIAEAKGKVIGNLNFSGRPRKRNAHVGEFGVSVLKEYWGKSIGEKLIEYLMDWSKNSGIIRKINLRVRTDNIRGIKLYKKLGFFEEGIVRRDFLINGKFYDSLLMGLFIDEDREIE
jgi:RimJ/RimL family protein N-acetyltransferase